MPDNSELNDIILNKSSNNVSGFKKLLLAIATFAVLLIIVIVVMSSLDKGKGKGLKQTILPPEPTQNKELKNDLFKSVDVVEEQSDDEQKRLEEIANELKTQIPKEEKKSNLPQEEQLNTLDTPEETVIIDSPVKQPAKPNKQAVKKHKTPKKISTTKKSTPKKGTWYVQVGSFEKPNPHKKLVAKIKRSGYTYIQYKTRIHGKTMTKFLIGPFRSYKDAQKNKSKIAATVEPAAFIYRVPK